MTPQLDLVIDGVEWGKAWAAVLNHLEREGNPLFGALAGEAVSPLEYDGREVVLAVSEAVLDRVRGIEDHRSLREFLLSVTHRYLGVRFVLTPREPQTTALEVHLLRLPIWSASRAQVQPSSEWRHVGSFLNEDVHVLEPLGPLVMRDLLLTIYLMSEYRKHGQTVPLRLNAAAKAAGYRNKGGKQRQMIEDALTRMKATVFRNSYRLEGKHTRKTQWSLLDETTTTTLHGGWGVVRLSDFFASLIEARPPTFLDIECLRTLVERNEHAARLWLFLEGESMKGRAWEYLLFSAPTGKPPAARHTPAIADLLRIERDRRRDTRRLVERAAAALCEVDTAYEIAVEDAVGREMSKLVVNKDERKKDRYSFTPRSGTESRANGYRVTRTCVLGDAQGGTGRRASTDVLACKSAISEEPPSLRVPSIDTVASTVVGTESAGHTSTTKVEEHRAVTNPTLATSSLLSTEKAYGSTTNVVDHEMTPVGDILKVILDELQATPAERAHAGFAEVPMETGNRGGA